MTLTEQIKFLAENYMYSAALNIILVNGTYFDVVTVEKAKLLEQYKPEPKSPEYGTWDAACQRFFKTI